MRRILIPNCLVLFGLFIVLAACQKPPANQSCQFISEDCPPTDQFRTSLHGYLSAGNAIDRLHLYYSQSIEKRLPLHQERGQAMALLSQGRLPMQRLYLSASENKLSAKDCAGCHQASHNSWQQALHSKAFTNVRFQAAFQIEPDGWCLNCHAPLWWQEVHQAKPSDDFIPPEFMMLGKRPLELSWLSESKIRYKAEYKIAELDALAKEGVNCAVCHLRDEVIITGQPVSARERKASPHKLKYDPMLRSNAFCGGCHQFPFPKRLHPQVRYTRVAMQNTLAENMEFNELSCAGCHYVGGNHLPTSLLKSNFQLAPQWTAKCHSGKNGTHIKVERKGVGHHLPTGDMFRQVWVELFDNKNKLLHKELLARQLNRRDLTLTFDNAMGKNNDGTGVIAKLELPLIKNAGEVRLSMRLQGAIEGVLLKKGLSHKQLVAKPAQSFKCDVN